MRLHALPLVLLCLPVHAAPAAIWTPTGVPPKTAPASTRRVKTVDVLVIGAGVAGLTMAKEMKQAGRKVALLEAADRIGGRVYTDENGHDFGAAWNHNAANNRLATEVYGAYGAKMVASSLDRYLFIADASHERARAASEAETADFRRVKERVEKWARRVLRDGKDLPASELSRRGGKWAGLIAAELGELDAGVNLDDGVSAADIFGFGGGGSKDKLIEGGLGRFYTKVFAKGVRARLNTAVTSVDYSDPKWTLVTTAKGEVYRARAVVNTTSTGVLAKGHITFSPPLPDWKKAAIDQLRMGTFNKIILEFDEDSFMRYGGKPIEPGSWVMNQVNGREDMAFVVRPFGKKSVVAFVGGEFGERIERMGDERATKLALKNLKRLFGDAVKDSFVSSTVTRWGRNPFTEGSYAYSAVRDLNIPFEESEPRSPKEASTGEKLEWHEVMAQPVPDVQGRNRIYFAGEAVGVGDRRLNHLYQTTVAGAYVSSKVASKKILAQLDAEDAADKGR
jgi:monoamine oxidase